MRLVVANAVIPIWGSYQSSPKSISCIWGATSRGKGKRGKGKRSGKRNETGENTLEINFWLHPWGGGPEAMCSMIATEQVLGGLQINRWKGESTPLDNHVNVVLAILPAIYMHCAGPSCLVSLVYSHKPFCSPPCWRRRRVIRSNQWNDAATFLRAERSGRSYWLNTTAAVIIATSEHQRRSQCSETRSHCVVVTLLPDKNVPRGRWAGTGRRNGLKVSLRGVCVWPAGC